MPGSARWRKRCGRTASRNRYPRRSLRKQSGWRCCQGQCNRAARLPKEAEAEPAKAAAVEAPRPTDSMKKKTTKNRQKARSSAAHGSARLWQPIKTAPKQFLHDVDLWMIVHASPLSMGIGDSFRVTDAYWMDEQPEEYRDPARRDDWRAGWFHSQGFKHRRLNDDYITHWMPIPEAPNDQ